MSFISSFPARKISSMPPVRLLLLSSFTYLFLRFTVRLVKWHLRIRRLRQFMPVEPVLFPNTSIFRLLAPQKWQTFHRDWHMRYGREIYRKHNSGIFALVSLFQTDKIFVADPEMFVELKVTGADRFQINIMEAEKVTVSFD